MYLITNRHLCSEERYFKVIEEAMLSGIRNIIIREKDLDDESLEKIYIRIKNIRDRILFNYKKQSNSLKKMDNLYNQDGLDSINTYYADYKINLIINSNTNIFKKLDCDGLHLPFNKFLDLLGNEYEFNKEKILGLSIHSIEEIIYLEDLIKKHNIRVDYIIVSHIYETKCKEGLKAKGIEWLKEVRKLSTLNIVALGGILPCNVSMTLKHCDDFAVMSTVMKANYVSKIVDEYLN